MNLDETFWNGCRAFARVNLAMADARAQGGVIGRLRLIGPGLRAGAVFASLRARSVKPNALQASARLEPVR